MKKIFKMMFAVVAGVAALTACTNEPEEGVTPTPEAQGFTVVASMDDATKATLVDGESIKWENNDKVTAWYVDAEGNFAYALREEAEAVVSEDGYTATLNYTTIPMGSTLWLAYGSNTAYDGCSARKVEFNYTSNQTQAEAGVMNKEYLRLVGEETNVTEENGEYTAKMKIVGTIMRYIIYSSNGTYATESVKKVELVSTDNALAGSGAAIAYNFAEYKDTEKGYKYHTATADAFSDECTIFWDNTSKSITTTLTTPMALSATDAASSKGIYMTVPAVSAGGYKYVVTTDKAIYTFDASTTAVKFNDNVVKNVLLDVENEKVTRVELSSVKGSLRYAGSLNATHSVGHTGCENTSIGYWYAETKDINTDIYVKREGQDYIAYYENVVFECIDNSTNEVAEWLTVRYNNGGNSEWRVFVDPQEEGAPERSATVTAYYGDVDGYIIEEAFKTKSTIITQVEYSSLNTLSFAGGIGDQTISGAGVDKLDLGWCVIKVNNINAESWGDNKNNEQELYGSVKIECRDGGAGAPIVDWLTVEYGKGTDGKFNSTHLLATASANDTGAERKALVCCTYNAPEGYEFEGGAKSYFRQFFVTQPANSGVKEISFWGGIGAEFTHDATAQQDWGLSYWVINVDGATVQDWSNDSHNEQLLYGSAEFKCYDYTDGVRGAEVDWVTVEYKQENGRVIDTWWLADIQENTGAARAAEIVCTWPEIEGYTYKDGQNVKTTIIRQEGVTTGDGEDSGDSDNSGDGSGVTAWNISEVTAANNVGMNPTAQELGGVWFAINSCTIDGISYTNMSELSEEQIAAVTAKAFVLVAYTYDDIFALDSNENIATNCVKYTGEQQAEFFTLKPWINGTSLAYSPAFTTDNPDTTMRYARVDAMNSDGTVKATRYFFQNK